MQPVLRLCEDILPGDTSLAVKLPATPRVIYVVHGHLTIAGQNFGDDEAWHGCDAVTVKPGTTGVTYWRWDLAPPGSVVTSALGAEIASSEKLSAQLDTLPMGELLMRGDSVAFPPAGCAYLHRHRGPGIRCLIEGGIRIDTHGHSTCYGPGGAWYESGPDAVFAQAALDRPSRFIRVMILPRELLGKSSLQYLNEEDKDKPRSQQYKVYVDAPIALGARN